MSSGSKRGSRREQETIGAVLACAVLASTLAAAHADTLTTVREDAGAAVGWVDQRAEDVGDWFVDSGLVNP